MNAIQIEKARKFRELHDRPGTFVIPNPWDAGTARILAALGFEALATTSSGMAFSLGRRDGSVSRDECFAHIRNIVEATGLPVSADLEKCFGDAPAAVAETIRLAAETGIVGGSVEDATGDPYRPIYDFNHAVERVAAAVEAARSLPFPFTLTARAENFLHGHTNLDETIRRLQAFAAAGACVLFAPGLPSLEAVKTVCSALAPRPVNAIAGRNFSVAELSAAGARRISVGGLLCRAALGEFLRAAREIKDQGTFTFCGKAAPMNEVSSFMKGE
jgi:2-methylisocitrate lyase-like PEP mutase family enzyme